MIARDVVGIMARFRRLADGAPCVNTRCVRCESPHVERAAAAIRRGRPVEFVLPGFPAKSPNPRKVLGILPDEAELQALRFLEDLCDRAREFYEPGARVIICSDGRVFGDYVGIPDGNITAYQDQLAVMLRAFGNLSAYNLDDKWPGLGFDAMRQRLNDEYADSDEQVRASVTTDDNARRLYLGISRFLFEDQKGNTDESNRTIQRRAKQRAYGVIQRSKAWGALVSDVFPTAVRLSIHPQPCGSSKLGIRLGRTPDAWLTPWHSVAVRLGEGFQLMKRHEAEAAGAKVVSVGGEARYMSFPTASSEEMRP